MTVKMKKTFTKATFQPAADFVDPRLRPGFKPRLWPRCNGEAAPAPRARGLYERRCLEFLAAFYRLNLANQRLLDARKARAAGKVVKSRLAAVATSTADLEVLEDRYAPIGFFGEPLMDGILYQDIIFARPEVPKHYPQVRIQTMVFQIPGLEDIPKSELRGRAKIRHFGHAKLDL